MVERTCSINYLNADVLREAKLPALHFAVLGYSGCDSFSISVIHGEGELGRAQGREPRDAMHALLWSSGTCGWNNNPDIDETLLEPLSLAGW